MGLQSHWMELFAALLAGGALVGTVWVWPRLGDRRWTKVLARLGLVLACQLTAVLLVALLLNNYFDFYNSWGDLLGQDLPSSQVRVELATGSPAGVVGAGSAAADHRQPSVQLDVDRSFGAPERRPGHTVVNTLKGPASNLTGEVRVYLPAQYQAPEQAKATFPVVLAIAGYPGHIGTLERSLQLPRTMNTMLAAGRVRPMIIVMVSPTLAPPRDTECADAANGPKVETWLSTDLPTWVRANYRVAPNDPWGVLGVSTGGFCATKLALRHPDLFAAGVSLSGYLHAVTDVTTGDLYGGDPNLRNQSDPLWRVRHLPTPPIRLLLATSESERTLYNQIRQFVDLAHPPLQVSVIYVPSGGHNFGVWITELPACLQWLSLALPGGPQPGLPPLARV